MKKITVYEGSTLVEFSASIADLLESGDMIVLALDSLRVDGKVRANWGTSDTVRALKIAGRSRYADTWTTCAAGDCDDMLTGHRVEVVSETLVSLPVGLDEFESVSITVTNGEWERHSRLTVAESIVATAPLVNAVVLSVESSPTANSGRMRLCHSKTRFAIMPSMTNHFFPLIIG